MTATGTKRSRLHFSICICLLCTLPASGQIANSPEVPSQFKLDTETAARLRPELMAQSVAAAGHYATGRLVFERLAPQVQLVSSVKVRW